MILTKEYFDEKISDLKSFIASSSSNLELRMNELKRQKRNGKEQTIMEQIRILRRLDVNQIQKLVGASRNWCLTLMRKLANEHPEIQFILGDKQRKIPSSLIYDASKTDFNLKSKIIEILSDKKIYSYSDFARILRLDLLVYLNKFREICDQLIDSGDYEMIDGNKIHLTKT